MEAEQEEKNGKQSRKEELCELLAEIEENISDEAQARQGYYELMEILENQKDISIIEEIISDELNHAELLKEMAQRYSGIKTADS